MNSSGSGSSTVTADPYWGQNTSEKELLSNDVREIIEQIIVFVMGPISVLGVVTNLINLRVFIEQGVRNDSTNISFVSLSLFDLLSCTFLIPYSLCYVVMYTHGLSIHRSCTAFATPSLFVHVMFQNCSAWTTVYMSLMRSLCVVIPLRVKLIFTPKVSTIVIIIVFIFFFSNQMVYLVLSEIVWIFDHNFNESIAYIFDTSFARKYLYHNTIMNNQVLSVVTIITVSITTSLMVHKLIEVKKWRLMNTSGQGNKLADDDTKSSDKKTLASKDIELVKSVTTVTAIFLVCVLMGYIPATAVVTLPEVSLSGLNRNLFYVVYLVRFLFDAVNSSINFFFYIQISSRYKTAFASSFTCSNPDVK